MVRIGLAAAFTLGGLDLLTATLFLSGTGWLVIAVALSGGWLTFHRECAAIC